MFHEKLRQTYYRQNMYEVNTKNQSPRSTMLDVCLIPGKGRGIITVQSVQAGTLIEIAPVVSFSSQDRPLIDQTELFPYYFVQPSLYSHNGNISGHMVLGFSTLCNHADIPNAHIEWKNDDIGEWAHLVALKDIAAGEEVTLYYTNIDEYTDCERFV